MSSRQPTSFRFTTDELELIDAHAHFLSVETGVPHSRSDVIRATFKKMEPPEGAGEHRARFRRAYSTVFRMELL